MWEMVILSQLYLKLEKIGENVVNIYKYVYFSTLKQIVFTA